MGAPIFFAGIVIGCLVYEAYPHGRPYRLSIAIAVGIASAIIGALVAA